jgi:6-phosphofructokinase 1
MRIGVLTGGGDCPGLNAVIRAIVKHAVRSHGWSVSGVRHGWRGLLVDEVDELDLDDVSGILPRGGTILGTSRTNPYHDPDGEARVRRAFGTHGLDALIAIGGEDTLGAASKLAAAGLPIVGVPKTIDNDVNGTDFTFGFDTALTVATEAIDRLHTTAESHDRVMVVEVMGRHAGWIALESGIAGGADLILVPEFPITVREIGDVVSRRHARGKSFSIIVVAEGARVIDDDGSPLFVPGDKRDAFGHVRLGGIAPSIAERVEATTGFETRYTVFGHIQRGGSPTAFDRVLGSRFGVAAVNLVASKGFGRMVAVRGTKIVDIPLAEAVGTMKTVTPELYEMARVFFS